MFCWRKRKRVGRVSVQPWCGVDGTQPDTKPVVWLFVVNARGRPPSDVVAAGGRHSARAALPLAARTRRGRDYDNRWECSLFKFSFSLFGRTVRWCAFRDGKRARAAVHGCSLALPWKCYGKFVIYRAFNEKLCVLTYQCFRY